MAKLTPNYRRILLVALLALPALFIITPLLHRGYVLTLDMVFTPNLRMPMSVGSSYLLQVLLRALNFVIPSDIIEKLVLFALLIFSEIGIYQLIKSIHRSLDTYQKIGSYFAAVLYMANPFTYDRFMAGQYNLLLGYALLPWFTSALLNFFSSPSLRSAVIVSAWAIISAIVSIHSVGFMLILTVVATGVYVWVKRKDSEYVHKIMKFEIIYCALFLLASSYWLVPLVLGHGNTASIINSFGASDLSAFSTLGGNVLGRTGEVLQLQGFWLENRHMYYLPQETVPVWRFLSFMIWVLVSIGVVTMWRSRQRILLTCFSLTTIIAACLATGIFNNWLTARVPIFAGYREPEKFVALIALTIAVLAAYGVANCLRYSRELGGKAFTVIASVLLLLLPVVWTPTIWWGFNNQLSAVQYPADWYNINRRLTADHSTFQTLFLPWHLYMYFGFAGRIIANPATTYFNKPVIVSDNPEFKNISYVQRSPTKRKLDQLLPSANKEDSLGKQFANLNIKYIIFDKDDDFKDYSYIQKQHDLKQIYNNGTLELYVNDAWGKQ